MGAASASLGSLVLLVDDDDELARPSTTLLISWFDIDSIAAFTAGVLVAVEAVEGVEVELLAGVLSTGAGD